MSKSDDCVIYATAPRPDLSERLPRILEGRGLICDQPMRVSQGVEYRLLVPIPEVPNVVATLKRNGFLLLGAQP